MEKLLFEGTIENFLKKSYFEFRGAIKKFYVDCEFEKETPFPSKKRMVFFSGYMKIEREEEYNRAAIIIAANPNFGKNPLTNWYGAISIIPDKEYREYFVRFESSSKIGNNNVNIYEIKA